MVHLYFYFKWMYSTSAQNEMTLWEKYNIVKGMDGEIFILNIVFEIFLVQCYFNTILMHCMRKQSRWC